MAKKLTIVAGMHRSGTSLMASMLQIFGIDLPGDLVGPAADNEKGFFEDRAIIALNDEIMQTAGLRWDSLEGFFLGPEDFSAPTFDRLKERARTLLRDRSAQHEHWAFKDPRFSRLTGFWVPILSSEDIECRFVIAARRPAAVAGSLASRNDFPELKSLYLWFLYTLDVLLATQNHQRIIVSYDELMAEPDRVLGDVAQFFPDVAVETLSQRQQVFREEFLSSGLNHHAGLSDPVDFAPAQRLFEQIVNAGQSRIDHQQLVGLLPDASHLATLSLAAVLDAQQARQADEAAQLLEAKEQAILEFKRYQSELEQVVADKQAWSAKLEGDVSLLTAGSEKLSADVASLNQEIVSREVQLAELDAELAAQQTLAREHEASIERLKAAAAAESSRLWAIVEMYRIQAEQFEQSLSWRVTRPLRWLRRVLSQAPFVAFRLSKRGARHLVYLLPEDSMLRQRIIKTYERTGALMRGEVDNESIRASHRALISERQQYLPSPLACDSAELPDVDISIVTYNSERWIEGFVKSLRAQDYPLSKLHLFFVDNGSTDETVQALQQQDLSDFAEYSVTSNQNTGFGGGHNVGVAKGSSDFVLVTNIDIEFHADSLTRALSFAASDDARVASWELRQAPYEHPKFYDPVSLLTGWSAHACIVFRRSAFESVAGYEPRIFMYGEDVELSYRLRAAGYLLRYMPFAVVNHYTYETPGEVKRLQYQGSTLANAFIRLRYGSMLDALKVLPMFSRLLMSGSTIPDQRTVVMGNIRALLRHGPYFFSKRTASGDFSFRAWDYDIVRAGAFYERRTLNSPYPLVSVITRTYRGRQVLLRECLQSVANQTYPHIEHIVVEDGGDEMQATIAEFREAFPDSNIQYFPLPKGGRCVAGNKGLAQAEGQYLVFLDDDDLFFADHIEVCISELQSDPDLSGVYALAWEVETSFEEGGYEEHSHGTPAGHVQPFDATVLREHNFIPIQSLVFDRALYEQHGGFDPELDNLEDWNLWVRYTSHACFKLVEKTTSMYRTPWDLAEKSRRQAVLDEYLDEARAKNRAALVNLKVEA